MIKFLQSLFLCFKRFIACISVMILFLLKEGGGGGGGRAGEW